MYVLVILYIPFTEWFGVLTSEHTTQILDFGFIPFFLLYSISPCLSVVASVAAHCEKPGKWLPLLQDQKLLNGISQK